MLIDVLTRLAADTGYHPVQQRNTLVELLNNSATQMHAMLQGNRMLRETTLVVQPDSVVSLPSFLGELRGLRMHTNELPFDVQSLAQPRYTTSTLGFKFKNWRDKGISAIHTNPNGFGKLKFHSNVVENVEVLISGKTNLANKIEEKLILNAIDLETTNLFGEQIDQIACLTERTGDIIVKDANNTEIAILYNNERQTKYRLIDVSQVFWTLDSSDGGSFIDVLYKLPIVRLAKDSDSFYAGDEYDVAWYHYSYYLHLAPLQGREADAKNQLGLSIIAMNSIKDNTESNIIKKFTFGRNRFFGLFRKYRYFPGSVTNVDHNIQP